jgi:hypothetical protein
MIFMEIQMTSVSLIKWEAVFDPTFGCIWMFCSVLFERANNQPKV